MLLPNIDFEKSLLPPGTRYLLGIDEVGRGPLAGPVTIGAFLLDLTTFDPSIFQKLKVRDSKMLTGVARLKIKNYFAANNYNFQTFSATSTDIDQKGITVCILDLISRALEHYRTNFDYCLIDGNYRLDSLPSLSREGAGKGLSVVSGDAKCFSIAAASIVAKVDRDTQMDQFDKQFPHYGFAAHKGYGTHQHLESITKHGPSPIHRRSFSPFKPPFVKGGGQLR